MAQANWYDSWFESVFFHQLQAQETSTDFPGFIKKLLTHLDVKPQDRVLDVNCGTGLVSALLSNDNLELTGIDKSGLNIDAAAKKIDAEFYVHDVRLPAWGNYFNCAFCLLGRFGYFATRREHDDAMRTISNSIVPGGTFVIDYPNLHYKEGHLINQQDLTSNETSYSFNSWDDENLFYRKINVTDKTLGTEPLEVTEKFTKLSLGDFTDMLSFQGMQVQEIYGDYLFGDYNLQTSPRLIIIASKSMSEPVDAEKRIYKDGRAGEPK